MNRLSRETIGELRSPLARVIEVHGALASTQERARELARAGAPHGTLVVAGVQTGGRGRLGRHWGSPEGGLWMSLVLRPGFDASLASRITQTAAVGVRRRLEIGSRPASMAHDYGNQDDDLRHPRRIGRGEGRTPRLRHPRGRHERQSRPGRPRGP